MKRRQRYDHWSQPKADYQVSVEDYAKMDNASDVASKLYHYENQLSQEEAERQQKAFVSRFNVLSESQAHKRPIWLFPLIGLCIILLFVFWLGPFVLEKLMSYSLDQRPVDVDRNSIYGSDVRVISQSVVTLYREPDIKSEPITQVLLNTPVQLFPESVSDEQLTEKPSFYHVQLLNGESGYVTSAAVSKDMRAIEPSLYDMRLIVTDADVNIMTHAYSGNVMVQAKQGTILYVLYAENDIYRVALPDLKEGWIQHAGVRLLGLDQPPPKTDAETFAKAALAYDQSRYLKGGISTDGIDILGVLRNAAYVNGVSLPATEAEIWESGTTRETVLNSANNSLVSSELKVGDVVFARRVVGHQDTGEEIVDPTKRKIAIWIGDNEFITESVRSFAIVRQNINEFQDNWQVIRVATFFPTEGK